MNSVFIVLVLGGSQEKICKNLCPVGRRRRFLSLGLESWLKIWDDHTWKHGGLPRKFATSIWGAKKNKQQTKIKIIALSFDVLYTHGKKYGCGVFVNIQPATRAKVCFTSIWPICLSSRYDMFRSSGIQR